MKHSDENLILLVEDNDEDFVATRRAFQKSGFNVVLHRVENAVQALDFPVVRGDFKNNKLDGIVPSLILLDLNLPGVDGRDFLLQLKSDDRFREIPVVILTTSTNPRDVLYCYRNGANGYQVKAVGFDKFLTSMKTLIGYWFETAVIPTRVN